MRRILPLVIAIAACGKVHNLTDAGGGDGMGADSNTQLDAAGPDADPHGAITVLVNSQQYPATPLADVPVVFVDPGGAIVAEVRTGSDGKATATVLPGASVTAVYDAGTTSVRLETVTDVAPGDTIVIGPMGGIPESAAIGTFTVNLNGDAGAFNYDVYGPCGATSASGSGAPSPATFSIYDYCQKSPMDLVAVALNSDHNPQSWQEMKGVPFTPGGSVTFTGAWQPLQQLALSYAHASLAGVISVNVAVPDQNGLQQSVTLPGGLDPATGTISNLPGAATSFIETTISNPGGGGGQQQIYQVVDGTKTTYDVDLSTALTQFIGFASFDASTTTITPGLTAAGGGDVLQAEVDFSRIINDQTHSYTWEVWSPPADAVALPPMPTDLADCTPTVNDAINGVGNNLYAADAITSWAQVRGSLFGAFDAYYAGRADPTLGKLVWSYPTGVSFTGVARRAHR